jgi:YD repeat-containing protein
MTDRERFNLRGPVKSCEIHRTWYSRACTSESCETEERTDTAVVEFLEDGSLQRHSQKNPAPVLTEWTHIYEYDVHGRLRALRSEEANIVHVVRRYEYDAAGRLSHLMVIDRDGNSRAAETYTYAADGTNARRS